MNRPTSCLMAPWRLSRLFGVLFLWAMLVCSAGLPGETLTILYTNDAHSHVLPFDLPEFGKDLGGIVRREAYVKSVRAEASASIVVDAGDVFQGTPFYSFFKGEVDIMAYDLCGYEAMTLGNHDLDNGLENLQKQLALGGFPLVCSNVVEADTLKPVFVPYLIVNKNGLKVALMGVIGGEAWSVISVKNRERMTWLEPTKALPKIISSIRDQVDVILLLSHSGFETDLGMARNIAGIDVIVGGHTNTWVETPLVVKHDPVLVKNPAKNRLGGTLVVQAFKWGLFVGRLDLTLNEKKEIVAYRGALRMMDQTIPLNVESPVFRLISAFEERIKTSTSQIIGRTEEEMPYQENLKHRKDLPLGTFVCEALREFGVADLAIINSGAIRDRLPAGNITMGTIYTTFPFDNTVMTLKLKGRDIQTMLNYIAGQYGKISGFQYGGLKFQMNLASGTASEVLIGDRPLEPGKEYKLATISYLTDGNQHGNILFKNSYDLFDSGFFVRDVIMEYMRKHGVIKPPPAGLIRFSP